MIAAKSIAVPIALMSLALTPAPAFAYGGFGHNVIVQIAMANVTPRTRAAVMALVKQASRLDTKSCATKTVEDLSVWPDCARALGPRFSYTAAWHYQNVNICTAFDLKSACKDGNCVSAQIERDIKLLKDRSVPVRERAMALSFLIHFTGDLHMPLHAGDHGDLGGNQIRAAYGFFAPDRLNLHSIWDGVLAERAITSGPTLVRRYTPGEAAPLQSGSVEDWSRESWDVSRALTYPSAVGSAPCTTTPPARARLENPTIEKLLPAAKRQIERAGLRLARLLDEALG